MIFKSPIAGSIISVICCAILSLVFVTLKVANVVNVSWMQLLASLWAAIFCVLVVTVAVFYNKIYCRKK